MTKLRFPLAKPHSVVRKLLLPEQSKYTYLCDVHSGLNADFVHQWFKYLALEVGARMEILRSSNREHIGAYAWDAIVKPLTRIHKIWLSPEQVQEAFGNFVESEFDPQYSLIDARPQADGCEACILARIGTHINTVWALHTLVKSRITLDSHARHPSRLRLLRLIDAWIQHYQERYSTDTEVTRLRQRDSSTGLAEELYEIREEIKIEQHRMRRAQRKLLDVRYSGSKKYKKLVKDLDDKALEDNIYDAENDIIDHYAALRATQRASALILAGSLDPEGHQPSAGHTPYPLYRNESKASISAIPQDTPSTLSETTTERFWDKTLPTMISALVSQGSTSRRSILQSILLRWPHLKADIVELDRIVPHRRSGQWKRADHAFYFDHMSHPTWRSYHGLTPPAQEETATTDPAASKEVETRTGWPLPDLSLTGRNQVHHNGGIEPDFYCRPQDQLSRYTDIPVIDDGSVSRASVRSAASAASGYSAYYQRNGARGYPHHPSNLRFESRLSRPFDEPAAPPREDPFHLERYR